MIGSGTVGPIADQTTMKRTGSPHTFCPYRPETKHERRHHQSLQTLARYGTTLMTKQHSINDLSHLSEEEFIALCPQGEHAPGPEPLSPIERDAARYRWIKSKKVLTLQTDRCTWFREDGTKYYPSHFLSVNHTGFNGVEHLDGLIDQAMEMYP
jgi:hypothetical protein